MLWYCKECTTAYAIGIQACPHCGTPSVEIVTLPAQKTPAIPAEADESVKPKRKPHADG